MANVLITGGTGFIGSHVVDALLAAGYNVCVVARKTSRRDFIPESVPVLCCSLFEPSQISTQLKAADYFIHIAGLTSARRKNDFYAVNAESVRIWLEALEKNAPNLKKFVLLSSQAAARPSSIPIDEDVESEPLTDYGKSKLLGEKYAKQFMDRIPVTIIRAPATYGPRDRDIFFYFKLASIGILPMIGNMDRVFSAIYVEDLASAIVLAMEHPNAAGETFFATDGVTHTWREFALEVGKTVPGRKIRLHLPAEAMYIAAALNVMTSCIFGKAPLLSFQKVRELIASWACNGTKITRYIGFHPKYDIITGIRKTAEWYIKNGWIKK